MHIIHCYIQKHNDKNAQNHLLTIFFLELRLSAESSSRFSLAFDPRLDFELFLSIGVLIGPI